VVWDRASLKVLLTILPDQTGGPNPPTAIEWTADEQFLLVGRQKSFVLYQVSMTGGAKVWGMPIAQAVQSPVTALKLSADNKFLAVGSQDGTLQFWSFAQRKLVGQVNSGAAPVLEINFSKDDRQISVIKGGSQPVVLSYANVVS
jgi:WD40 repeat protein